MSRIDWFDTSTSTSSTTTGKYYKEYVKQSYVEELERAKHDLVYFAKKCHPIDFKPTEYILEKAEDMALARNARDAIHKKVAELEERVFEVRGSIGCDIKDVIVEVPVDVDEPETPEEALQYFDPKDLDI